MNNKYIFLYNGHEWRLMIDSLEVLKNYMSTIWDAHKETLAQDIERLKRKEHTIGSIIHACETLAITHYGNKLPDDVYKIFEGFKSQQYQNMEKLLQNGKILYANSQGGYSMLFKTVINRYESKTLEWPIFRESDIYIKKFPRGIHYYAYIGPVQVKENGIVKWNTEEKARAAAMKYVANRKGKN